MAHKVLSSDMAELISAMKLAQQYSNTLMDADYRKGMLRAAHVLAMDSKNLLDSVDNARRAGYAKSSDFVGDGPRSSSLSESESREHHTLPPYPDSSASDCWHSSGGDSQN